MAEQQVEQEVEQGASSPAEQQVEQEASPAPEAGAEAGAETGEGAAADAAAEGASQPPATDPAPWARKRIDDLTREKNEAKRRADELEQQLRSAKGAKGDEAPEIDLEKEIDRRAAEKAAVQRFNDRCNDVFQTGKKEFPDFELTVERINRDLGTLPLDTLAALLEVDAPHKVLHHLGSDLNEAARVLSLPPLKQAMELARISANLIAVPTKAGTKAPPPITPRVGGSARGEPDLYSEKMTTDEWMAEREKQLAAKRKAG